MALFLGSQPSPVLKVFLNCQQTLCSASDPSQGQRLLSITNRISQRSQSPCPAVLSPHLWILVFLLALASNLEHLRLSLRNCPDQVGLWECTLETVSVVNWCGRAQQPAVCTTIPWAGSSLGVCKKNLAKPKLGEGRQGPSMVSAPHFCLDFPQSWAMTWGVSSGSFPSWTSF